MLNFESVASADLTTEEARAARRAKRAQQAAQALSFAALLLLLLACSLYLVIVYTGWNQHTAAAALFCAGLAGYPALAMLWFALSSQMFNCWRAMSTHDRFTWSQKIPTVIHAVIMTLVGVWVVFFQAWQDDDIIKGRNELVAAFIGLELGYLVQLVAIEAEKQRRFSQSMLLLNWLHHVSVLLALPWYYKYKLGDFFFGAFFLTSASTVPMQGHWFMRTAGLKPGLVVMVNHVLLLLSFLLCRVLLIPYLIWVYSQGLGITPYEAMWDMPWQFACAALSLMAINTAWFIRIVTHPPRRGRKQGARVKAA